jgi:hypothetical protein
MGRAAITACGVLVVAIGSAQGSAVAAEAPGAKLSAAAAQAEPVASEPLASEPLASEPSATKPSATDPSTTEPSTTEPGIPEPQPTVEPRPWEAVDDTPPGVRGPKHYGFDFRRRNHTGVGVTLGTDAFGLVVTSMLSDKDALQVSVGVAAGTFSYWSRAGAWLSVDYLNHPPIILTTPHLELGWQLGFGVSARAAGRPTDLEAAAGLCAIGAVQVVLTDVPMDVTLAFRPGVLVTFTRPAGLSFAYGDIAAQARWWF